VHLGVVARHLLRPYAARAAAAAASPAAAGASPASTPTPTLESAR
jgi:hypothetical protein